MTILADIAGVYVTVRESDTHVRSAQMTEQVCETGRVISDHIILKPRKITVQVEQSNTPMNGQDGRDAVMRVFSQFEEMWSSRKPTKLVTEHATYPNMVLTDLSAVHRAPFKWTLKFTCTFTQVNEALSNPSAIPLKQAVNPMQVAAYKTGTLGSAVWPQYGYDTPFVSWVKLNVANVK